MTTETKRGLVIPADAEQAIREITLADDSLETGEHADLPASIERRIRKIEGEAA